MTRKLYEVEVVTDMLIWAKSEEEALDIAREGAGISDMEFIPREIQDPMRFGGEIPYGAGVTVKTLLAAGPDADPETLREAWRVKFGDEVWLTDGCAMYPEPILGWYLDESRKMNGDAATILADRLDGSLPKIDLPKRPQRNDGMTYYKIANGLNLQACYVDPVMAKHPGAVWYHDGTKKAAVAKYDGQIVAIVMPILAEVHVRAPR